MLIKTFGILSWWLSNVSPLTQGSHWGHGHFPFVIATTVSHFLNKNVSEETVEITGEWIDREEDFVISDENLIVHILMCVRR